MADQTATSIVMSAKRSPERYAVGTVWKCESYIAVHLCNLAPEEEIVIRQPFKARTSEELIALLSAVATAMLAFIIITTLYFGREIFVPIALAILLSFVLAPLVGLLQRIRVPRGLAVVSVVIIAFALIFATGSLLATQLTQLAGDLPRYQSTISDKIQSFRETTASRGTLERASGMLKDLSKELDKPKDAASALSPKAPTP